MTSLFLGLSSTFTALSNIYVAGKARDQQALLHELSLADTNQRFLRDLELRKAQFTFSKNQAEQAFITRVRERDEDARRKEKQDKIIRSSTQLSTVLQGTPDGLWLHDPYTESNPGIKSLRVLLQKPKGMNEIDHSKIEDSISKSITEYSQLGIFYPINFPTGMWKDNGPNGSWIAWELHAWDQTIPTLILRIEKAGGNDCRIKADIFGFAIGKDNFKPDVSFGTMGSDLEDLCVVLPALVLATADIYFLHTYGKAPLLPHILQKYFAVNDNGSKKIVKEIVDAYSNSVSDMATENTQLGIHVVFNLIESFADFPDKTHALNLLQKVEDITKPVWLELPEIVNRLYFLYSKIGDNKKAEQILKENTDIEKKQKETKGLFPNLLSSHI